MHGEVLERAFQYWKNVDQSIGERIEAAYKADDALPNPGSEDTAAKSIAESKPIVEEHTHAK